MFKCFLVIMAMGGNYYGIEEEYKIDQIPGIEYPQTGNNFYRNISTAVSHIRFDGEEKIRTMADIPEIKGRIYGCYESEFNSKLIISEDMTKEEIDGMKDLVDDAYF